MNKNLSSKCLALLARCRMTATPKQSKMPDLFAYMPTSLLRYATYAPSFLPGLRANRFPRGVLAV
jgi:hypothetical protein